MRIFSVRLLHTTPADVVRQVHDRRQHLPNAPRPALRRDGVRDSPHQGRIPGRRQRYALREYRSSGSHETVQGLIEGDDRDAEPGLFDEVALNVVDARRVGRRQAAGRGIGKRRRWHRDLKAERSSRVVVGRIVQAPRRHVELPELLLQRHAAEEILYALRNRAVRVPVWQELLGMELGRWHRCRRENSRR